MFVVRNIRGRSDDRANLSHVHRTLSLFFVAVLCSTCARAQSKPPEACKIILPSRLAAGQGATLAVLSADGHLQPNASVAFSDSTQVRTDATGRALFTAPSAKGVLLAHLAAQGQAAGSAAALVVAPLPPGNLQTQARIVGWPSWTELRDQFAVYGTGFRGDADGNLVRIAGKQAFVLAASPVSLVLLPDPQMNPGAATLVIQPGTGEVSATLTLLDIAIEPALAMLPPGKKESLNVRVLGTNEPRKIEISNLTPDIIDLHGGKFQRLKTSGGANNSVQLEVQGRREGDYSLKVELIPPVHPADMEAARIFLRAAASRAAGPAKRLIADWAVEPLTTEKHEGDIPIRIGKELARTTDPDVAALLRAALNALGGSSQ